MAEGLALLEGSRFLGVERLEAQCTDWLCAHVEASNCVAVWVEASRLGCGLVAERALVVVGRLAAVGGEAEFLGLRREGLLELVRSDGLAAWSERAVYEAVMGWVRHDVGTAERVARRVAWCGADGAAASVVPRTHCEWGPVADGQPRGAAHLC